MSTNTHVNDLKINKLKEAQFDAAVLSGVIDGTQLSIITDAGLSYNELEDLPQPVQVTSLPTASASEVGKIYQFTGTTGTYTNGYFYKCVSDGAASPTYSWVQVEVQPSPDPLPSQAGNSGKFLTTDGTNASWATVDALPAQSGQSGKFLTTNGTDASWANLPTEVEWATYGTTTYQQVKDWYDAGKMVLVKRSTKIYRLTDVTNSACFFFTIYNNTPSYYYIYVHANNNTWDEAGNQLQDRLPAGTAGNVLTYTGTKGQVGSTTLATVAISGNSSDLNNDAGFISGISSSDVISALGYTPYNATNPNGYQANVIESISVNNTAQTITSKNVNITVPTTAADVNALPSSTKYAASMTLSINSSTYVVTAQLKDQNGNNLGTAQTIDLPLESVVVNGEYDSVHKKIVLTLQSGSTVEFSVADLVSGLQSEITSSNKLDADLVDDSTSTNKFVTASDKTTWSGKQDALVSGTNIKTVNGNSLLGSGNVALDTLPDQTGNSGKFLKTNGTTASWANGLENLSTAEQSVSILGTGSTLGSGCINIGTRSNTRYGGIALGYEASCTGNIGIALSQYSLSAGMGSVAIGYNAKATIDYAIQMGAGTNNTSYTFQVYNYRLMNADGTIPEARLASTSSATAGQALVLDSNLDAKWTTIDALPSQTGQSGKFLTTNGTTASWDSVPSGSTVTFVEW